MSPPPFSPWLLILFLFINHTVLSHQKVTAGCMNGVSWPQRLPCITNAFASGWTPGSAGKYARNARNGPMNDKKDISPSRLDWKPRNNRLMDNNWREMKGMMTKSGMEGDGTGCLDRHGSRFDTKTTNTVTAALLGSWEWWRRWDGDTWREKKGMGWVGLGWLEKDGWKGHGEKSQWAVIELQRRKTNYHPSKGRWARAIDNCGTGRGHRDRGMSLEMRFPLISPWLGDNEWEEEDTHTHTHLRGRFLARESLDLTDSTSLWLSDPVLVLSPTLCHLQRLSSSVWTAKTTLPNPDPD